MTIRSLREFDSASADVLNLIDQTLFDQSSVESILEIYTAFCSSDEARRLDIAQAHISTEKKWFLTRQNQNLNQTFHGALATAFIEHCDSLGMNLLHEIQLVAIHPKPEFGFGDCLDPVGRLDDYRAAFLKEKGGDLVKFGKRIGMALDAAHYPLLEIIGGNFGKEMLLVASYALAKVFSPSEPKR